MGILAALLRRRPVRHAQHRAASAGAGACRRLVPRAPSAGRRAAVGARGRSAARHPPTRHAPRPAAVGVDASHPRRRHRDRARTASLVAGGPRGWAAISATCAGSRRHRREAGGQFAMAGLGMEPVRLEQDLGAWRTEGTRKGVAMTGAATLRLGGEPLVPDRPFSLRWAWRWRSVVGQVAEMDRLVAVARADTPEDDSAPPAGAALKRSCALGWRAVLAAHETAWNERWTASDIFIEGDDESQQALRFAVYHLTSAANPEDDRVSIGARALTGDAYLGHVFWDTEIYLLPFYTAVWPEAARALLMYRYHTLPAARAKAAYFGFKGALYAWESADTGMETTPERVVVSDGTVVEILTGQMEHHISADVAYAVWQYWRATGDDDFFLRAGAEILLDTARFWASRAVAEADGRRHIRHVIGPDEYHEDVDDNAFTNVMARWNIARALEAIDLLRSNWPDRAAELCSKLALADWRDAVARIVTGLDTATGLYDQFAGFTALEPFDLAAYADRTLPIDVVI